MVDADFATTSHAAITSALAACNNVPRRVRSRSTHLLDFEDLPSELQTNPHIRGSYRRHGLSMAQTIWSLLPFNLHTETVNVWSHILGFILFACLTRSVMLLQPSPVALTRQGVGNLWDALHDEAVHQENDEHYMCPADIDPSANFSPSFWTRCPATRLPYASSPSEDPVAGHDASHKIGLLPELNRLHHHLLQLLVNEELKWPAPRWPLYVFTTGAMVCMALSAICHGFACCGQYTNKYIWRLDYAGITVLIVSSFFPMLYYGMLCHPNLKLLYLITTCTMGGATAVACLSHYFNKPGSNGIRASMFAALGLWGTFPVMHLLILNHQSWHVWIAFVCVALHGAIYLGGAAIYVARIPERWRPGKFDIFLSSHQWFHFAVVAAALLHFYAMKLLIEWRDSSGGVCAVPYAGWPAFWGKASAIEGDSVSEVLHLDGVLQLLKELTHGHWLRSLADAA